MKLSCIEKTSKLEQEIEKLKAKLELVIKELYHKAGITLNLEENNNGEV